MAGADHRCDQEPGADCLGRGPLRQSHRQSQEADAGLALAPQQSAFAFSSQQLACSARLQQGLPDAPSGLVARMIAACICGSASWVNRTDRVAKPDGGQPVQVLLLRQRPGDAARERAALRPDRRR